MPARRENADRSWTGCPCAGPVEAGRERGRVQEDSGFLAMANALVLLLRRSEASNVARGRVGGRESRMTTDTQHATLAGALGPPFVFVEDDRRPHRERRSASQAASLTLRSFTQISSERAVMTSSRSSRKRSSRPVRMRSLNHPPDRAFTSVQPFRPLKPQPR